MRRRLEKSIERSCKTWAQKRGWWCAKFKSPGKRSAPDDVFSRLFPMRQRVFVVEFKAEGEVPTENQLLYHTDMRSAGWDVYVFDNVAEFKAAILRIEREELGNRDWLEG